MSKCFRLRSRPTSKIWKVAHWFLSSCQAEVAFKIWLKHETFLIYRVLRAECKKIETYFQLWVENLVNWSYLSASGGIFSGKMCVRFSWHNNILCVVNWSNMHLLHAQNIKDTISKAVAIWNFLCAKNMLFIENLCRNIPPFPTWQNFWNMHYSLTSKFRMIEFSIQSHQVDY